MMGRILLESVFSSPPKYSLSSCSLAAGIQPVNGSLKPHLSRQRKTLLPDTKPLHKHNGQHLIKTRIWQRVLRASGTGCCEPAWPRAELEPLCRRCRVTRTPSLISGRFYLPGQPPNKKRGASSMSPAGQRDDKDISPLRSLSGAGNRSGPAGSFTGGQIGPFPAKNVLDTRRCPGKCS